MIGLCPRCYTPSFVDLGLLVPKKRRFLKGFNIYVHGGHLGHVSQKPRKNFRSSTHGGSTQNLALIGKAVSEKKMILIVYDDDFGRRTDGRTDG